MQIYRVVVRGQFADLDEAGRDRLRSKAADHHFLRSAFTAEGSLTYDDQLAAFNVRYEVRDSTGDMTDDMIAEAAVGRTAALMSEKGYATKKLRATITNMATMWQ